MNIDLILEKRHKYNEILSLIPDYIQQNIKADFNIKFTHTSTSIEGNTLTLIETKVLLEDNISIGGKNLREIYEVVNNHKANLYVEECVSKKISLNEDIVKEIHAIISNNIIIGGIYRNDIVRITGASFKPPAGQQMYQEIKDFFSDLNSDINLNLNEIELVAWTHAEFVRIHPFIDGNGRTSRLIMNYQLMMLNFPPVCVPVEEALNYYQALDKYGSSKDLKPFANFVANLVEKRLDEYIEDYGKDK